MSKSSGISIKEYVAKDMDRIIRIFYETSVLNLPILKNGDLTNDFVAYSFLGYYFYYEPQSFFVAYDLDSQQLAGYICGAVDYKVYAETIKSKVSLKAFKLFFGSLKHLNREGFSYLCRTAGSFLRNEYGLPKDKEFLSKYPAHLHINIAPQYQNQMVGQTLMSVFLEYLKENNVPGVFLRMIYREGELNKSYGFFRKQGFSEVVRNNLSFYAKDSGKKHHLVTMAKNLGV